MEGVIEVGLRFNQALSGLSALEAALRAHGRQYANDIQRGECGFPPPQWSGGSHSSNRSI